MLEFTRHQNRHLTVLGAHYQQFLCLSLEEILMIAMNILFEELLIKNKNWGTLRNFFWSIFEGPSDMRVQFLLWTGHLPVSRFNTVEQVILFVHLNSVTTLRLFNACWSFETFQCMLQPFVRNFNGTIVDWTSLIMWVKRWRSFDFHCMLQSSIQRVVLLCSLRLEARRN
jgi:hypothetical protein